MSKLSKRDLQAALDALTSANNQAVKARNKIVEHCEEVYGVSPYDVNNDDFIDGCDGGSGVASGMTVKDFEASMREAIDLQS